MRATLTSCAQGLRLFDEGRLVQAVLAFEAQLQRDPDNAEVCAQSEAIRNVFVPLEFPIMFPMITYSLSALRVFSRVRL
jgi:hypothetical protein